MTPKEFVSWLQGYTQRLRETPVDAIELDKIMDGIITCLDKVIIDNPEVAEFRELLEDFKKNKNTPSYPSQPYQFEHPNYNNPCPYPTSCGMPAVWHGTVPPVCQKCGKQGVNIEMTYRTDYKGDVGGQTKV